MLQHLEVNNFAIIEHLTIDFKEGMTVLTGETGAGKSIIIDAVGLLVGGRSSTDFIRYGCHSYRLRGIFYQPHLSLQAQELLADLEIPFDDHQLLISREVSQSGKNTIKINGVSLTVALLKQVGQYLVDIHGQNEHQVLMDPKRHRLFLDRFGGEALYEKLKAYQETFAKYQVAKDRLDKQNVSQQERAQRIDLLQFQINDIESCQLHPDEESDLEKQREQLMNYQTIAEALQFSHEALTREEWNITDQLGQVVQALEGIATLKPTYQHYFEQANNAYYVLQELSIDIHSSIDDLTYDEEVLNQVEERLSVIHQLKRKYGDSIPEILTYADEAKKELEQLENYEGHLAQLEKDVQKLEEQLLALGQKLHQERIKAGQQLEKAINHEMASLYMEKAQFFVQCVEQKNFRPHGLDQIEFLISTNLGEPAKPLVRIASGGELSRIMLAMKTIFQTSEDVTSIIFDEVDTGVSGRVAQAIADKMGTIAHHAQVLCISHLPQVAARADHQLHIVKKVTDERTSTQVKLLNEQERIHVIAQMSAGENLTEAALAAAKEMRRNAKQEMK